MSDATGPRTGRRKRAAARVGGAGVPPSWPRQVVTLLRREIRVELAGREVAVTVVPFVAAATVLAGLGFGPDPDLLRRVAPGLAWLLVLTAAVPLARLAGGADRDDDAWDLLRGLARPSAVLAAKVMALWLALAATWVLAAVLGVALLRAEAPVAAWAGGAAGTLGLAAVTVVFGALLSGGARQASVLAALVLPAGLPALLAGTQAWSAPQALPWLALLVVYDVVVLVAAWAVFPAVLED